MNAINSVFKVFHKDLFTMLKQAKKNQYHSNILGYPPLPPPLTTKENINQSNRSVKKCNEHYHHADGKNATIGMILSVELKFIDFLKLFS